MKKTAFIALLLALISTTSVYSVNYPDTVWVKVTFYDFKADGSNPNFQACNTGYKAGIIQNYLDAWRKPVFKANLACNTMVGEWYRVSGQTGPDTPSTQFVFDTVKKEWKWTGLINYAPGGVTRPNEWVGPNHDDNYAMTDLIMFDSLPFILIDSVIGMYEYNNQQFFPLDGKGYGTQPAGSGHNFSFTMETHNFFTYSGGEVFRFTGDDDVWAFINGQLAMDIGGVHAALSDSIIVDNVAAQLNIEKDKTYAFDFFYAERHTTASTIRITTDLLKPQTVGIIVRSPFEIRSFQVHRNANVLHYSLPYECWVSLKYYDLQGRIVSCYINRTQEAGDYSMRLPSATLAAGTLIQVFQAGSFVKTEKVAVTR